MLTQGVAGAKAAWGSTPALVFSGQTLPGTVLPAWVGWLTAPFIHAGWTHLGGNMLILLAVGFGLEPILGRSRFLIVYLVGSWLGIISEALLHAASTKTPYSASVAVAAVWFVWLLNNQAALQAFMPQQVKHGAAWRWLRVFVVLLVWAVVLAAGWSWFGYQLWAALNGAGLRVFWSRAFCAQLFGALAGGLIYGGLWWARRNSSCLPRRLA
ncbi:rhomboid family intramembrane serine protease [bacterium]|nr:rhomboid family intramembrane serine protease [bacterium]